MSGRYTDLSIHLRAAWNRQHILNGGPPAAPVPGWFLRVTRNEGYDDVLPEFWLDRAHALAIAVVIDGVLHDLPAGRALDATLIANAVVAADDAMRAELARQLAAAEDAAARIPALRAALGVESGAPETKGTPE